MSKSAPPPRFDSLKEEDIEDLKLDDVVSIQPAATSQPRIFIPPVVAGSGLNSDLKRQVQNWKIAAGAGYGLLGLSLLLWIAKAQC